MERPKVGVGVIILKGSKVLLQKRKNAHGEGTWSFPGGHLEFNEELDECARRETFEEVGIHIKNVHFATITNDKFATENKHYITIFMLAEHEVGVPTICEPDKTESIGWFSWDALPKPLFLPLENLLQQGFKPFHQRL
ncbi:NUDIX domain-containing protein [Candidatus Woesearchaeota archaeon]|nr:NUDIX domain-containing protein [Candidatus Woesearchaeota archaeon]